LRVVPLKKNNFYDDFYTNILDIIWIIWFSLSHTTEINP